MCNEFWRYRSSHSEEQQARKRAEEIIDKAKAEVPPPQSREPVVPAEQEDTVPA